MRRVEADGDWSLIDPSDAPGAARPVRRGVRRGVPGGGEEGASATVKARDLYGADDAYPRADRQRVDDVQGRGQPAVQPDRRAGQHDPPVEPVHRDPRGQQRHRDGGVQPRLDQPRPRTSPRTASTGRSCARRSAPRWCSSTGSSTSTTTRPQQAAASNPRWRPVGLGLMGLQDAFFTLRLPFDSAAARELSTRVQEEIFLTALETRPSWPNGSARTPRTPRPARPRVTCTRTCGARADPGERWAALRERIARARPAQLAAGGDRADRHHRVDRRLLRVHRAAGVQPVQARDHVRGVPPDQHLPGPRAEGARAVDAGDPRADQAGRRVGAGHRRPARRGAGAVPHRVGAAAAGADRPGRRPGAVHRPVAVAEPVHERADHRQALLDVPARLEVRAEDHLLPALAARDPHPAGHRRRRPDRHVRSSPATADEALACSLENPETCEACQ